MATYSRTMGNNSSTDTQSSNLPAVRQPMQSMELGQIIVHSLEVVSEALENKDVPVTAEQITKSVTEGVNKSDSVTKTDLEKSITEAINNSDLAKKGLVTTSGTRQVQTQTVDTQKKEIEKAKQQNPNTKNNAALAMQDYWEQKKFADEKKRKDKQAKLENESRNRKEKEYTQQIEQVFSKLNQFSKNPLAGVVNTFESGIKKFFNKTMNTSLSDVGKHMKKGADIAFAPIKATGKVLGAGAKATLGATQFLGKAALTTTGLVAKGVGGIAKGVGNVVLGGVAVGSLIKDRMLSDDNVTGADLGELIEGAEVKPKDKNVKPKEEGAQNKEKLASGKIIQCESIICKNIQNGMGNDNIKPKEEEEDEKNSTEDKIENIVEDVASKFGPKLASLIESDKIKPNPELANLIKGDGEQKNKDLANLLQPDAKDSKKDRKEQKKEQAAQGKIIKSMGKGVEMLKNLTLIKFGAIVAIIGGIAAFLPQIIGMLTPFINNIPMYWQDLKIKLGYLFKGPYSIGEQIKLSLMETVQKIGKGLMQSDNSLLKSLGKGMLSSTAGIAQEELKKEFKQSQQYKTMLAHGMNENDLEDILNAKNPEAMLSQFDAAQKDRYSKKVTIKYKTKKGKEKTQTGDIAKIITDTELYGNEKEGLVLRDKFVNFYSATSTEDIESNKFTDEEWGKFMDYLWDAKIGTDAIYDIQNMYNDKLALAEWLKVTEARKNGELQTDFTQKKADLKEQQEQMILIDEAKWRIDKAQAGGVSLLDFQTDTEWETNPYLKDIKDEYMSKYAKELSNGEKVLMSAMEAKAAGQRMTGNLAANVTGHSNSWQNSETKLQTSMIVSTTGSESGDITRR